MRVLVANRGEIAVRIVRACRDLGFTPLVAYSQADRDTLAVRLAEEAFCIGPGPAAASYLDVGAVLTAARALRADAIHPGYGFLSENAAFARACADSGIRFVGPSPASIELMGDKISAREHALSCGVPVVPGTTLDGDDPAGVPELARRIGLPAIVKAAAGGGGRGMRRVDTAEDLDTALSMARAEAGASFGDDRVYLERYVPRARHVEIQVFGRSDGRAVSLGERDCSVQRRHQKLIEESRCGRLADPVRAAMTAAAVQLTERTGYLGAGTVEFLLDLDREEFYFLEMNTRLQVEHGVTELALGVDLVAEQLLLAATGSCRLDPDAVRPPRGHVIECRILSEDPDHGFRPTPGTVTGVRLPAGPGVRVDTYVESGTTVSPYYDSMIAKVLAIADDRAAAIARMRRALGELELTGLTTNIAAVRAILDDPDFRADEQTTSWFDSRSTTERASR